MVIKADRQVILNRAVRVMDIAKEAGASRLLLANGKGNRKLRERSVNGERFQWNRTLAAMVLLSVAMHWFVLLKCDHWFRIQPVEYVEFEIEVSEARPVQEPPPPKVAQPKPTPPVTPEVTARREEIVRPEAPEMRELRVEEPPEVLDPLSTPETPHAPALQTLADIVSPPRFDAGAPGESFRSDAGDAGGNTDFREDVGEECLHPKHGCKSGGGLLDGQRSPLLRRRRRVCRPRFSPLMLRIFEAPNRFRRRPSRERFRNSGLCLRCLRET